MSSGTAPWSDGQHAGVLLNDLHGPDGAKQREDDGGRLTAMTARDGGEDGGEGREDQGCPFQFKVFGHQNVKSGTGKVKDATTTLHQRKTCQATCFDKRDTHDEN